jgi:hypothetical protein
MDIYSIGLRGVKVKINGRVPDMVLKFPEEPGCYFFWSMQALSTFSTNDRIPVIPATGCGASCTIPRKGGVSPTNARFVATDRSNEDPITRLGSWWLMRDLTRERPWT